VAGRAGRAVAAGYIAPDGRRPHVRSCKIERSPTTHRTAVPLRRAAVPAAAFAVLAACAAGAAAQPSSPCDDKTYAREFRMHYPDQVNHLVEAEFEQQAAYSARAKAIGDRVVAVGAASREQQNATYLAITRTPQMKALDERIRQSADDFRLRNDTLVATPPLALLDPMRPNRAWCMLASQALQSLNDKLAAEIESWSTLDAALRAAAAERGVRFAN